MDLWSLSWTQVHLIPISLSVSPVATIYISTKRVGGCWNDCLVMFRRIIGPDILYSFGIKVCAFNFLFLLALEQSYLHILFPKKKRTMCYILNFTKSSQGTMDIY